MFFSNNKKFIFILKKKNHNDAKFGTQKNQMMVLLYTTPLPLLKLISSTHGSSSPFDSCNESQYLGKISRMNCIQIGLVPKSGQKLSKSY
jgi:hypothetical protein